MIIHFCTNIYYILLQLINHGLSQSINSSSTTNIITSTSITSITITSVKYSSIPLVDAPVLSPLPTGMAVAVLLVVPQLHLALLTPVVAVQLCCFQYVYI